MHIHTIEVEGFKDGARSGNIALVSDGQRINVPLTMSVACDAARHSVVAEAIRLTRRLPEFRTDGAKLSFAPTLLARYG